MSDLSIIIKALLESTDSDIKSQLNKIQSIVSGQDPIKLPVEFDPKAIEEINKATQRVKEILADVPTKGFTEAFGIKDKETLKQLAEMAQNYREAIDATTKDYISGAMFDKIVEAMKSMKLSLGDTKSDLRDFVDYVNASKIRMEPFGFDYEDMRRSIGARIVSSGAGLPMDSWYQEAREMFQGILPDVANIEDQFETLYNVLKQARQELRNNKITGEDVIDFYGGREEIENGLNTLLGSLSTISTEAENFTSGIETAAESTKNLGDAIKTITETRPSTFFEDEGLESAQRRIEEIRDSVDSLAKMRITTEIDDEGIERVTQAVLHYKTEAGNAATETMRWNTKVSELGDEAERLKTFETVSIKYDDNIEQTNKAIQQTSELLESLTTKLDNLARGTFDPSDLASFVALSDKVTEIGDSAVTSTEKLQALNGVADEINNIIARSRAGQPLETTGFVNFQSDHEEITRYIAALKDLEEAKVQVSEKGRSIATDKATGEQFRTLTLTVEEAQGKFREYALTVSSLTDEFRLLDNGLVNVSSNLAQKENILMARLQQQIQNFQTDLNTKIQNVMRGDISDVDTTSLVALRDKINDITTETEGAEQKMKDFRIEFKELSAEIKRGRVVDENPLGIDISSTNDELRTYISNLKSVSEENVSIENSSRVAFGNKAEQIRIVNTIISDGAGKWQKYQYAINATTGQVRELDKGLKDVGTTADDVINSLAAALAAGGIVKGIKAIRDALKSAVYASIAFESALAGVRKVTDFTVAEMARFNREMIEMSQIVPMSVVDLSTIAEALGRMGIGNEDIAQVTRTMADLAVATDMAGEAGATMFARFANIMQLEHNQLDRLGSSLVELGNNAAASESEIMTMALRLAAAGQQAEISAQSVVGMAAAMSALALPAELGGTAMQRVLSRMAIAVADANEELTNFARVVGVTEEAFSNLWRTDSQEALLQFIEGLSKYFAPLRGNTYRIITRIAGNPLEPIYHNVA